MSSRPNHLFTVMADDVRLEAYNKVSLVGVYGPDLIFSELPAALSKICFFVRLRGGFGVHRFEFQVEGSKGEILGRGSGALELPVDNSEAIASMTVCLGNARFVREGPHRFVLTIEGDQEPLVDFVFNVVVNPLAFAASSVSSN